MWSRRSLWKILAGVMAVGAAAALGSPSPAAATGGRSRAPLPRPLYVSNIISNDVSTFDIGPDGGPRLREGRVPASGAPRGIVVSPDGRTAYVANGTSPVTGVDANAITTYRVGADGGLTPLDPPTTANEDPDGLAIAPGGRTLYAVNRATATVSAFAVASDGRLSPRGEPVPSGDDNPRAVVVTPDGRFAYVANGSPLDGEPDLLTRFAVQRDGTLRRIGQVAIGAAGGVPAISADGRFLYVPCSASNEVFGFAITADGDLRPVPGSPFFAPDIPIQAAVTPDGRHLYVADGGLVASTTTKVSRFAIGGDGALVRLGDTDAGISPVALTPTPDGRFLYVSNINSDDVSAFEIQPDGDLRKIGDFRTGGDQPAFQSIAVRPNQGPRAAFAAGAATAGRPIRFDATGSADRDGVIARFDWDFGDGTTGSDAGPRPLHTYQRPGVFQVRLTVTDNEGCGTRPIFTGTSPLCTGSAAARATQNIVVR